MNRPIGQVEPVRSLSSPVLTALFASFLSLSTEIFTTGLFAQGDKIVRMQTLNVRDILYILTGGSNTLALMRDEGTVLVDTKPPGWGRAILDNLEAVSDK